eukprot:XP_001702787.1 predicted protein [Chlamydomonas reinhardtii]
MWFAIVVTVLAAAGNNIGKVLQKQATRTLPRLVLNRQTLLLYLRSALWVTGMLVDLGGALLMIVAFANAPVSIVQPVSAVGLVILLIFSHFYLKERLQWHEWLAACVAFVGVLGLGASAEPSHMDHPDISAWRVLGAFSGLVALLGLECWWRHTHTGLGSGHSGAAHHHHHHQPAQCGGCRCCCGGRGGRSVMRSRGGSMLWLLGCGVSNWLHPSGQAIDGLGTAGSGGQCSAHQQRLPAADEGSQGRQHGDCVRGRRHVVHDYGRGGGHVGAGRKAAQRAWYEAGAPDLLAVHLAGRVLPGGRHRGAGGHCPRLRLLLAALGMAAAAAASGGDGA